MKARNITATAVPYGGVIDATVNYSRYDTLHQLIPTMSKCNAHLTCPVQAHLRITKDNIVTLYADGSILLYRLLVTQRVLRV